MYANVYLDLGPLVLSATFKTSPSGIYARKVAVLTDFIKIWLKNIAFVLGIPSENIYVSFL